MEKLPVRRLSAGAVVVRMGADGPVFLLLRAFRHWDFPKGMVEPDERPKETALREISEETTISDMEFPWADDYFETAPYNRGKVARYYIGVTRQKDVELPVNTELGRPEHNEYRWVNLGEARKLASPRVADVLDWAARIMGLEK